MKLKLSLGALALSLAGLASAAGQFDGIYQIPNTQEWYSVHQNGDRIIVGGFFSAPQNSYYYRLNNNQVFTPPRHDNWDLFGGNLTGSQVVVSGESAFGACVVTLQFNFGANPVITLLGMTPTVSGAAQGIDCASVYGVEVNTLGRTFPLNRIF